jgi:NDP-sugar pyrophosphorylase family protein
VTEAILLVGGKGTRLRPLTVNTPKPMVPAAGVPFLTHQLARAKAAGVDHVVLATSYLAEVFEPYFVWSTSPRPNRSAPAEPSATSPRACAPAPTSRC